MASYAKTEIYEDKNEQGSLSMKDRSSLMTDEQASRGRYYADQYTQRRGEVDGVADTLSWDEIEKLYNCDRDPDPEDESYPNNFLPLLTPTVEGQVAHMSSAETEYLFVSDNPMHEQYMRKLKAGFAYNRRMSKFDAHVKDMDRSYILLGGAWITASWAKGYGRSSKDKPEGYAKISTLPIRSVLVDGRIKDFKDLQEAEYIIHEIGFVPISWIRKEYGDEYGDAVLAGTNRYESNADYTTMDDMDSAKLLHVWTRSNEQGNLQLIEMDDDGLILRESDPSKPYYEFVDNEYPFCFGRGMYIAGNFYGFGDGKILLRFQKLVNNLADEIELAARFSAQAKIAVDPKGNVDIGEVSSNPADWILCDNPNQNIRIMQGAGINPVVIEAIRLYLAQAQSATRFSDIMTGARQQASTTATATQNQVLQGSIGINDKKADVSAMRAWAAKYSMKLCLEKWDGSFWSRIGNTGETESVDMGYLKSVPNSIPATYETISNTMRNNPNMPTRNIASYEEAEDEDGNVIMADLDFDVDVRMGAIMQRGTVEEFNMATLLAQMALPDSTGQPKSVMSREQYVEIVSRVLGMDLGSDEEAPTPLPPEYQNNPILNPVSQNGQPMQQQGGSMQMPPANMSGTVPGIGSMDKRSLAQ